MRSRKDHITGLARNVPRRPATSCLASKPQYRLGPFLYRWERKFLPDLESGSVSRIEGKYMRRLLMVSTVLVCGMTSSFAQAPGAQNAPGAQPQQQQPDEGPRSRGDREREGDREHDGDRDRGFRDRDHDGRRHYGDGDRGRGDWDRREYY